MRSVEIDSVRRRLELAGLERESTDEIEPELSAKASRWLRFLTTFSARRQIGALLDDRAIHNVYVTMGREAQIDLLDGLIRWMEEERELRGALDVASSPAAASVEPELVVWARENGVENELDAPIAALGDFAGKGHWFGDVLRHYGRITVRHAASGEARVSGFAPREQLLAARAYLERAAAESRAAAAREARWARTPERAVLAQLARALLPAERSLAGRARFGADLSDLVLDPDALTLFATDLDAPPHPANVTLDLSRHEEGIVLLLPSSARPAAVLSLARWALDIAHDPAHPMHERLAAALEVPAWTRMLDSVSATLARPPSPDPTRLAFFVSADARGFVSVDVSRQARGLKGWNRGKRLVGRARFETKPIDPRERLAMLSLASSFPDDAGAHATALAALVGHPVVMDAVTRAKVEVRSAEARFAFFEDGDMLRPGLAIGPLHVAAETLGRLSPGLIARYLPDAGVVLVSTVDADLAALVAAAARVPVSAPRSATASVLPIIERAAARVPVQLPESMERDVEAAPLALFVRLTPEDDERVGAQIRSRVAAHVSHPAGEGGALVSVLVGGSATPVLRRRDLRAERHEAHMLAAALGLPDGELETTLEGEDALLALLDLARGRPDVELEWPDDSARTRLSGSVSNLVIRVRTAIEWFGVEGEADVDGERVKLAHILAAIRAGKRFVRVGPRRFAKIEADLRAKLERVADVVFETRGGALAVAAGGGDALEALAEGDAELRADAAWRRIRARLNDPSPPEPVVPRELEGTLRDYQRAGFSWLARLASIESGAILADDMGLGKTLQALALLLHRSGEGPALVVTPTSVSDNWLREASRFAPTLRMRLHRGAGRHAAIEREPPGPNDVLVASYDVVALDAESLSGIELATLVLDEAQWIKNPEAQRSKAVSGLSARVRVALTGTPLENRLSELWSIVSTVHPGLLGPWEHFRRRFAVPIERDGDPDRLRALAALVRPYLLRRTKEVVAPELPPRIELVRDVELSTAERKLYDAEREAALLALADADESKRFQVLASITRLRELACDSELVVPGAGLPSSKLAALIELVGELESAGRRVLVFSQFVRLLHRAAALLDARKTSYLMLDGSTPAAERQKRVERFMQGEATVFLLSLKAGGTGLNLTAADHVVHLDPWWNPAVEDQASDRAHRIGQDKPVTIVRLVAKGTIEEHVLAMHESKRALSRGVLDGAELAGTLSASELVSLIRVGALEAAPKRKRRAG